MSVSIVLCTAGRTADLARTLEALGRAERPAGLDVELVVVDNSGGTDAAAVVAGAELRGIRARTVSEPVRGLSRARNRGVAESKGRAVLFIDDDVRPQGSWLAGMATPILSGAADAVAGAVRLAPHLLRPWMTDRHRAWLASTERMDFTNVRNLIGANMAVSRGVFERVRGFDPDLGAGALGFGEESLFARELLDAGFRLAGAPGAVVEHHFDPSRLTRESWLDSARKRGEKEAYIAHHWDGRSADGAPVARWVAAARLLYGRARRPADVRREEGCAEWEMLLVRELQYQRSLAAMRGLPRKYARRGEPGRRIQAAAV
ncbi:MAG TPA: glycosyltransferase [Thermoanaerobaculia bacterium]|nr:glycosyltransferase [Thermoanaerobaculia bacterium]